MSPHRRSNRLIRSLSALSILLACACDTSEPIRHDAGSHADATVPEPTDGAVSYLSVIDQSEWANYPPELDPLADHQPDPIDCGIAGWFVERGEIEVSTGQCNYVLVEHPAQVDIPKSGTLELEVLHFDLDAVEPATAHIAVLFDDEVQWEREIPIPSFAYVYKDTLQATRALSVGEPVRLHLHNHGQNTWKLSSLRLVVRR